MLVVGLVDKNHRQLQALLACVDDRPSPLYVLMTTLTVPICCVQQWEKYARPQKSQKNKKNAASNGNQEMSDGTDDDTTAVPNSSSVSSAAADDVSTGASDVAATVDEGSGDGDATVPATTTTTEATALKTTLGEVLRACGVKLPESGGWSEFCDAAEALNLAGEVRGAAGACCNV